MMPEDNRIEHITIQNWNFDFKTFLFYLDTSLITITCPKFGFSLSQVLKSNFADKEFVWLFKMTQFLFIVFHSPRVTGDPPLNAMIFLQKSLVFVLKSLRCIQFLFEVLHLLLKPHLWKQRDPWKEPFKTKASLWWWKKGTKVLLNLAVKIMQQQSTPNVWYNKKKPFLG